MPACKLKAKCFGESDPLINPYIIIILLIIIKIIKVETLTL